MDVFKMCFPSVVVCPSSVSSFALVRCVAGQRLEMYSAVVSLHACGLAGVECFLNSTGCVCNNCMVGCTSG